MRPHGDSTQQLNVCHANFYYMKNFICEQRLHSSLLLKTTFHLSRNYSKPFPVSSFSLSLFIFIEGEASKADASYSLVMNLVCRFFDKHSGSF